MSGRGLPQRPHGGSSSRSESQGRRSQDGGWDQRQRRPSHSQSYGPPRPQQPNYDVAAGRGSSSNEKQAESVWGPEGDPWGSEDWGQPVTSDRGWGDSSTTAVSAPQNHLVKDLGSKLSMYPDSPVFVDACRQVADFYNKTSSYSDAAEHQFAITAIEKLMATFSENPFKKSIAGMLPALRAIFGHVYLFGETEKAKLAALHRGFQKKLEEKNLPLLEALPTASPQASSTSPAGFDPHPSPARAETTFKSPSATPNRQTPVPSTFTHSRTSSFSKPPPSIQNNHIVTRLRPTISGDPRRDAFKTACREIADYYSADASYSNASEHGFAITAIEELKTAFINNPYKDVIENMFPVLKVIYKHVHVFSEAEKTKLLRFHEELQSKLAEKNLRPLEVLSRALPQASAASPSSQTAHPSPPRAASASQSPFVAPDLRTPARRPSFTHSRTSSFSRPMPSPPFNYSSSPGTGRVTPMDLYTTPPGLSPPPDVSMDHDSPRSPTLDKQLDKFVLTAINIRLEEKDPSEEGEERYFVKDEALAALPGAKETILEGFRQASLGLEVDRAAKAASTQDRTRSPSFKEPTPPMAVTESPAPTPNLAMPPSSSAPKAPPVKSISPIPAASAPQDPNILASVTCAEGTESVNLSFHLLSPLPSSVHLIGTHTSPNPKKKRWDPILVELRSANGRCELALARGRVMIPDKAKLNITQRVAEGENKLSLHLPVLEFVNVFGLSGIKLEVVVGDT